MEGGLARYRLTHRYFNELITKLQPTQVFVFGSNRAGVHGLGAARQAFEQFGAKWGVGEGPTGQCYALPTKDEQIQSLSLPEVLAHVQRFLEYAAAHPDQEFLVTPVGCGLAGFVPKQIGPMFAQAPDNCVLHTDLKIYADQTSLNFEDTTTHGKD